MRRKLTLNCVMQMTFYILMNVIAACHEIQAYRHRIFVDTTPLCNNLTCEGGVQHTACKKYKPHERCSGFEFLDMSTRDVNTMIFGHNGIRNKISKEWDIGNMNILHWSRELERMSQHFLMDCQNRRDVCNFLVSKDITIGQNIYFSKVPPGARWAGRAIRHWYSELGYDIKTWKQYREAQKRNVTLMGFTQMIWPSAEFIGCAAARMFDGYMVSCYYHPAISHMWKDFSLALGCSRCPRTRPTCSRVFGQLCGLDIQYNTAVRLYEHHILVIITCILLLHIRVCIQCLTLKYEF